MKVRHPEGFQVRTFHLRRLSPNLEQQGFGLVRPV